MELTNELKARFFALYWGQDVAVIKPPEGIRNCWKEHFEETHTVSSLSEIELIRLRPISSITEEEKMGLFYFCFPSHKDSKKVNMQEEINVLLNDPALKNYEPKGYFDYLRAKSFLVDFMGIPSDQWIEWGVVKLKEA